MREGSARTAPGAQAGQVYFHISNCDVKKPPPGAGEVVAFREEMGPKGPITSSVYRATTTAGAAAASASDVGTPIKPAKPEKHGQSQGNRPRDVTRQGVVQFYNVAKGSGFLTCVTGSSGGRNVAVHITNCDVQTPAPLIGERVAYSQTEGPDPVAMMVTRPEVLCVAVVASAPPLDAAVDVPDVRPAALLLEPVKEKFKQLARAPSIFKGGSHPRYVYVDLDNVYVSLVKADHLASVFPGAASARDLQLDLQGFTRRVAEGSASGAPTRLIAFYFNTPESIAAKLRALSFGGVAWDVRKQETTSDTSMQLELLIAKHPCSAHPKTLVLVTGDGNVALNGMCFREIMDKYLRDAWAVEVHAWMHSMAKSYIEFQREYPNVVVVRPLDDEKVGEVVRIRGKAKTHAPGHKTNAPGPSTIPGAAVIAQPAKPTGKSARDKPGCEDHQAGEALASKAVEHEESTA